VPPLNPQGRDSSQLARSLQPRANFGIRNEPLRGSFSPLKRYGIFKVFDTCEEALVFANAEKNRLLAAAGRHEKLWLPSGHKSDHITPNKGQAQGDRLQGTEMQSLLSKSAIANPKWSGLAEVGREAAGATILIKMARPSVWAGLAEGSPEAGSGKSWNALGNPVNY
jgi:hypothetical protein